MSAEHAAGTIIRVGIDFSEQFTRIPNAWVRDPRMSYRARGILAALLSHGRGARVTLEGLVDATVKSPTGRAGPRHEGRDAIRNAIDELEAHGYLARPKRRVNGRYVVDWVLKAPDVPLPGLGPHRVGRADAVGSHRVGPTASVRPTDKKTKQEITTLPDVSRDGVGPADAVACWDKHTHTYVHAFPDDVASGDEARCIRCRRVGTVPHTYAEVRVMLEAEDRDA